MSDPNAFEINDPVTIDSVHGHVIGYPAAPFVKVKHLDGQIAHYARGRLRHGHLGEDDIDEND